MNAQIIFIQIIIFRFYAAKITSLFKSPTENINSSKKHNEYNKNK